MFRTGKVQDYKEFYQEIDETSWSVGSASRSAVTTLKATGLKVFIKESDSPTYPKPTDTPKTKQILTEKCTMYESHRINLINAIDSVISKYAPTSKTEFGNIINSIDFFRDNSTNRFMEVTPYIDFINNVRVSTLKETEKIDIMKIATYALKDIHEAGIVHSDLKPELFKDGVVKAGNIIIVKVPFSSKYAAKIIDFDGSYFAQLMKNNKYAYENCVKGTPGYMSPELLEFKNDLDDNEKYDEKYAKRLTTKSDIFTMGIIFHEYLTGEKPQTEENLSVGQAVLLDKMITLKAALPENIRNLINSMLNKDSSKRPSASDTFNVLSGGKSSIVLNSPQPWPEDKIEFVDSKIKKLGKQVKKGKTPGKYIIGEGFSAATREVDDLIRLGLAVRIPDTGSLPVKNPEKKDVIKTSVIVCEPWAEDNIEFLIPAVNKYSQNISRGKSIGKYILGAGFSAVVKTAGDLISLGLAKRKG